MTELDPINPFLGDKKILIFVGIGTFCAGILIGFKLAGGQKVELEEKLIQVVPDPIVQSIETEAEND